MKRLKILVADDHAGMRDCIVNILRNDFEVIVAVADGVDLIKAAVVANPDVIVSDVNMPRLGGVEAMLELRAMGVGVPFVLVTANPSDVPRLRQSPFACLNKSDFSSLLNDTVRSLVAPPGTAHFSSAGSIRLSGEQAVLVAI
jgi:CheY-like chemotaxis protein